MIPKDSKRIGKIPKELERFQKNQKDSKRIGKIPKDSKKIPKDSRRFQKDSKRFQKIPKRFQKIQKITKSWTAKPLSALKCSKS